MLPRGIDYKQIHKQMRYPSYLSWRKQGIVNDQIFEEVIFELVHVC